ncbi:MAG: efflux RND transporter periplasmic adaptor subunit [Phycisphaerales bacterium]|nr:efflux RND transporter periplasmic adaptor subunit [Phycisphaerales bacterium]
MNKKMIFLVLGIIVASAGTYVVVTMLPQADPETTLCADHQIKMIDCPFCHEKLVEEMGWCNGHDVEEAYCTLCNPRFIPAFKKAGDWCEEHQIPQSQCKECNHSIGDLGPDKAVADLLRPEGIQLVSSDSTLCADHQIEMTNCPICNKKLVEEMGWCNGHDVEEAYCTLCNPRFIPAFKKAGDWCEEHQIPKSQCKICNQSPSADSPEAEGIQLVSGTSPPRYQRKPSVTCKTNELRVRFLSDEIAEKAGLEYTVAIERPVTATLTCNAEIEFDGQHYARIASRVGGVVSEVRKDLGDHVSAGEVLAVVDSIELANAQGQFLRTRALFDLAEKNHNRIHSLVVKGIATEQDDLEAEARLEERRIILSQAREQLMNLGLNTSQIDEIATSGETTSRLPVTAPFDSIVVERAAVRGEVVDRTRPLFAVADTTKMWAMLDVYETDLFKVRIGQPVIFAVDGLPGEQFGGKITWISAHVDRRTRTLKARAEIDNTDGLLRANMFGQAIVAIHDASPRVVVPKSAVQWEGCCNVVFKKINDLVFAPEKVRLGIATDGYYEVLDGVAPNEILVTQGSYLLKTEILKGSIGAGCCEVDYLDK